MLRLLKYDLKRDLFMLLGGGIALVVVLFAIELVGQQVGMETSARVVLSIMTYTFFGLLIMIAVCNSFRLNIRSVSRRLVPLGSLNYVGSTLLYSIVLNIVLLALSGVQLGYYEATGTLEQLERSGSFVIHWNSSLPLPLGAAFIIIWSMLFLLMMLLLVMALMESLKFKGRALLAVVTVVTLSSLISMAENSFFGGLGAQSLTGVRIENQSKMTMPTEEIGASLPAFAFELVVGALFLWVTVKLIDRKVRVE